ncbi:MAG TPA: CPBP family glutamic-type intramembrane protease [Polyangiaceae bacterium]|nr:CPBP family glutamic-type intramembrane protease [Polyangiaceae bacterium]
MSSKPGAWVDLALTLPIFIAYQLGVVFLNVRNGADIVTSHLLEWVHGDRITYLELTAGIGLATVAAFAVLGRGQALRLGKLVQIAIEGAVYAIAMGTATSWVVGKLFAGPRADVITSPLTGLIMSFGAGFYEEIAFRVILFGVGAKVLAWLLLRERVGLVRGPSSLSVGGLVLVVIWAVASAAIFSGMHYVGPLGDAFDARSFVARGVLGLALTLVYGTRGFAAAVWTHALYDVWVLVVP